MTSKGTETAFTSVGSTSWAVEGWVHENSRLTGTSFLVSIIVARHHSRALGYAYPSVEMLARKARVSVSTVHRAVKDMVASGEWTVSKGRGGVATRANSTARANRYYPTARLAGVEAPSARKRRVTLREDVLRSLDRASVASARERIAISEIAEALPENLAQDLVAQIATDSPRNSVKKLCKRINELGDGIDWARLVSDRLAASNSEPGIVISWLRSWALSGINPEDYRIDLNAESVEHYGETGEDF